MSSELSSDDPLIGATTGGYRILSSIGSGTMGQVYEAEDVKTGTHVALKVLRKSRDTELTARFLREGKTLALLSHPNIVQLVDTGQLDDGTLYLATELVFGGSLREVMDQGSIEQPRALRLIRQLLDALQAAHDLGVVHRDIKPANVMVGNGDVVKVLDFGVAKLLQDTIAGLGEANLTSIGFSVFGSALYIAPESATGQPVDARIDIYSTGVMLFEMLAGRPPFDNEDPTVILRAHAFEAPPTLQQAAPARSFAPELEALVARTLAKKPDDRYASAAGMIVALEAVLHALEPKAPPAKSDEARVAAPMAKPAEVAAAPVAKPAIDQRRLQTEVGRRPKRRKFVVASVVAAVALGAVIFTVTRGGAGVSNHSGTSPSQAVAGIPEQGSALLAAGHAQFADGKVQHALAAYERALRALPALSSDAELRANLTKALDTNNVLTSILALDLLASLTPPAQDAIITYASTGKLEPARRRAVMIAERDGIDVKIDRVQSSLLDLLQASSCEERKAIIESLTQSADPRAIPVLKRMRAIKCVEQDAANAIARIEADVK